MAVTLYMNPVSTACRPISLFVAEKKMPVTEQFVDLMKGEHYGAAFSSINPCHLVPVLEDGDFRMAESLQSSSIWRQIRPEYRDATAREGG
jgi:glutathione S-transferase